MTTINVKFSTFEPDDGDGRLTSTYSITFSVRMLRTLEARWRSGECWMARWNTSKADAAFDDAEYLIRTVTMTDPF